MQPSRGSSSLCASIWTLGGEHHKTKHKEKKPRARDKLFFWFLKIIKEKEKNNITMEKSVPIDGAIHMHIETKQIVAMAFCSRYFYSFLKSRSGK